MEAGERRPPLIRRLLLATAMTIVGVNVWTGSPLLALWMGSQVQGDGPPKMGAVGVVVLVLVVTSVALTLLLNRLGATYDELTGQPPAARTHAPWLRSMRGEREQQQGVEARLTALERVLVITVVVAVATFEIWFFFFSGSSIGQS